MFLPTLKNWFKDFRDDEQGTVMVEAVVTLPLLFFGLAATYEFFELHRYNSARDKASYTIADMISREMQTVTPTYLDNAKIVFDEITNDNGVNQFRISVIKYDEDEDEYSIKWSQIRGTGRLVALRSVDVESAHDQLPIMDDGEEVILVESVSTYPNMFEVGLSEDVQIATRVLTSPRFAPQIVFSDG